MIGPTPSERQMIPRWRNSAIMIKAGESDPVNTHPDRSWLDDRSELEASLAAWRSNPSRSRATELLTSSFLHNQTEVGVDAAHFILDDPTAGPVLHALARRALLEINPSEEADPALSTLEDDRTLAKVVVHKLRLALQRNPSNPLGWADLAHAQASLGNTKKAARSMRIALAFNPNSRILLRSASRLYVHRDEPDKAHDLVSRSDAVRYDPWLLAAEIATASVAKRSSKFIRHAKRMVSDRSIRPFHMAELAGALATLELEAGKERLARKLFGLSLTEPTDNSVAQVEWASSRYALVELLNVHLGIRYGYEARARHAFSRRRWSQSVAESWQWLKDEPFSTLPAIFGSYAASVGGLDFEEAERIARAGLLANPTDPLLRNNLVFALANMNRVDEAQENFRRIIRTNDVRLQMTLLATDGLIHYRLGQADEGRRRYQQALEIGWQVGDNRWLSIASTFFAREELMSGSTSARDTMEMAVKTIRRSTSIPELDEWLAILEHLNESGN